MYVASTFFLEKLLAQLVDHAVVGPFSGVLDGTFCGLGQTPTGTLTPSQGLSAIKEADYDGYNRLPIVWKGPYLDVAGNSKLQADGLFFTPTDAVKPNQITSVFIADAVTAGNLLISTILPNGPIWLNGPQNAFALSLLFQLLATGNYGDVIVIS